MKTNDHPQAAETAASGDKGFGVAASPFNSVKFELGVILCAAVVLWVAIDSITANLAGQLLILVCYGIASMAWIIYRTKRILRKKVAANETQ